MNPPAIEVLKTDLTAGLTASEAAERKQNLIDVIMKESEGFDTPAHRTARVERAKLAASIMKNAEVSDAGALVIDKALAAIEYQVKKDQQKLENSLNKTEQEGVDRSLAALAIEKQNIIAARMEVVAAKPPIAPAPAPAPAAAPAASAKPPAKKEETMLESVVSTLSGVTDAVLPKKLTRTMSKEAKAIAAVATGAALVAGLVWLFNRGKSKAKSVGTALLATGAAIAGAVGLTWLLNKISLAGGLKAAGQKVLDEAKKRLKEARYLAFPWEKYGLTRAAYKEASKIYADKKEAGADEIKNKFFGGRATPEFELFMKDRREEAAESEPKMDENGVEKVPLSVALPKYYQAIEDSLKPFKDFCVRNKEGIMTIGSVTLAVLPAARSALTGTVGFTANRIKALVEFFGGMMANHPILSALAALGTLQGIKSAAHMSVPKDPANLQKFLINELADAGDSVGEFAVYLPSVPQEDWDMISGILQGSADATARLIEQTQTLFNSLAARGLEGFALSPTEEIEQENTRGLFVFVGFLENLKQKNSALAPQFIAISSFIKGLKYPLKKADIDQIIVLSKDFGVTIEEVGGLYLYSILDENNVLHTRSLCINPEISPARQADLARTFIVDAEDDGELANVLGQPLRQVRSWTDFVFFNGAKNEEEAAKLLENRLLGETGGVVVRGGYAFFYTVVEGSVKKVAIGPFETTVKPLLRYMSKGKFSSTEMLLDYTEGLLPVYVFTTTAALARGKFVEALGWKPVLRTLVYPIEGTYEALKLLGKSIVWPVLRGRFSEILEDPRIIIESGFNRRWANMKAARASRIPTNYQKVLFSQYRKLAGLEEARGLLAKARHNLLIKQRYIDAAQAVLNRVHVGLDAGQLLNDTFALDNAIVNLRKDIANGAIVEAAKKAKPLDYTKILNGGGSIDDLFKAGAHADEIFDAAIEANGGTHIDDLMKSLGEMDEAARATHMERLCKNIPIDDLKNVGFSIDDILLGAKNLTGIDKTRFIIEASKVCGVNKIVSGGISADEVHGVLKNADPSIVPTKLVTEAEDLMKSSKAAIAADTLGVKNALDPKALARLDDLMQDPFFAKLIKESGKSPDEAVAFMKHFDELSPDILIRLKESRGASKLLAGAIRTGEQAEVDHILKIANRAARIRVTINAAGVVGDLFCIYMMFEDLKANNMRIQKTNNPQLKLLYEQADLLYYAEGASGAAGLLLYGVAVYSSATAGAGVVAALGAPAGLVLLPLAAATYGARVTYVALERSAEYHTLTEKDIAGFSQGKILQHINATDRNTRLNFSQSLAEWVPTDSWTEWGGEYNPDSANLGARHEGYRAYYSLIALSVLPAPTVLDLDIDAEKLLEMEPEEQQRLLTIYQRETNSRFVFDALSYIAYRTEKSFEGVSSDILQNAQLYATRQYKTRKNNPDAEMPYRTWSDNDSWRDVESEIQEENASHLSALEKQMIDFSSNPKQFSLSAPSIMLDLLQHDLAAFEMDVLNTNYTGVADEWERNVARGYTAWQLRKAISRLIKDSNSREKMTEGRIKQTLIDCKDVLSKNPDTYALAGYNSEYAEYFHRQGSNEFALTPRGLLGLLDSYPILKPERVSDDVSQPTPITALRHHSGSEKSISVESNGAYISGLYGYTVQMDNGNDEKFVYGGDTMMVPSSGTYLFWSPENSSGKPDVKVTFRQVDSETISASIAEARQGNPKQSSPAIRRVAGNELLSKKDYISVESLDSYSIQFGKIFNKYLYMKFTGSKWEVSIGASEGPWHDTSGYRAISSWTGFSSTVAGKYNAIIAELDDINNQR